MPQALIQTGFIQRNRIIYLNGSIDEEKTKMVTLSMLNYECVDPNSDIVLYIDSYGGYVDSIFAICDTINMLRCNVATVCVGKAMSAAAIILACGFKGKRFITPHSRIMLHELSSIAFGKLSEIDNDSKELRRIQLIIDSIVKHKTKLNNKQIKEFMHGKDRYLSSEEALKFGFIDYIIHKPKDIYSRLVIKDEPSYSLNVGQVENTVEEKCECDNTK